MNNPIPYRLFYPIAELAQLVGCSREHVYELIRVGERESPPACAIRPEMVRRLNSKICISRQWLLPNEPDNVVQFPQPQALTDADVQRIADAVAACLIVRLIGRAA